MNWSVDSLPPRGFSKGVPDLFPSSCASTIAVALPALLKEGRNEQVEVHRPAQGEVRKRDRVAISFSPWYAILRFHSRVTYHVMFAFRFATVRPDSILPRKTKGKFMWVSFRTLIHSFPLQKMRFMSDFFLE
jgi:hypothetical protein